MHLKRDKIAELHDKIAELRDEIASDEALLSKILWDGVGFCSPERVETEMGITIRHNKRRLKMLLDEISLDK